MGDARLVALLNRAAKEILPVAADPGIVSPEAFLNEVLEKRLPNPFIPDTPARIACDTSQKIPVRFGVTLTLRAEAGLPDDELTAFPFVFALWLRYLTGVGDDGAPMQVNPDPRLPELTAHLETVKPGAGTNREALRAAVKPILSDASIFGVDLYAGAGTLAAKTEAYLVKMLEGPGAVGRALTDF
jgi:fructuronate reductase